MLGGILEAIFNTVLVEWFHRRTHRADAWSSDMLAGALADVDPLGVLMSDDGEEAYSRIAAEVLARYPDAATAATQDLSQQVIDALAPLRMRSGSVDQEQVDSVVRALQRQARRAARAR